MLWPSSSLLGLPTELFENVAGYLEDEQVSCLRLTCKRLQVKVHRRFRPRFSDRRTDLSTNSLQRLIDISNHPDLGTAVRNLSIIAVTYDTKYLSDLIQRSKRQHELAVNLDLTDEGLAQAEWEHSVLIQRQSEQASSEDPDLDLMMITIAFAQLQSLERLTLETAVYKMADKRLQVYTCTNEFQPWRRALYVYELVMSALAQSQLAMQQFNVFGGHWCGSVPTANLTGSLTQLRSNALRHTFRGLNKLSLCISPQALPQASIASVSFTIFQEDYAGTARLLQLCPEMIELELYIYQLHGSVMDSDHLLQHISTSVQLPRLSSCTLKGMRLREDTMIQFLHTFPSIQTLDICNVCLVHGSWRKILDYISSEKSAIDNLSVQRLTDQKPIKFSTLRPDEVFSVHGKELKDGLEYSYFFTDGYFQWRRHSNNQLRLEYGPPIGVSGRTRFDGIGGAL